MAADSGAMRRRLLTLAAIVIGLDLVSKQVMLALIFDPPRRIDVLPFLNFAPVWNPGISFGMLADGGDVMRYLLTALALAVAAITIGAGLWICSILVERETDSS